jgi:hypothetical protein
MEVVKLKKKKTMMMIMIMIMMMANKKIILETITVIWVIVTTKNCIAVTKFIIFKYFLKDFLTQQLEGFTITFRLINRS